VTAPDSTPRPQPEYVAGMNGTAAPLRLRFVGAGSIFQAENKGIAACTVYQAEGSAA